MKLIYIMGKSSSGKDTIYHILKEKLDVNTYVMYTTRPMREEEVEGETYYYISSEEMEKYIKGENKEQLIEQRTYQTVYGPWTYATIADQQFQSQKDMIMLGTLESYLKVKENFKNQEDIKLLPVYIEVPDGVRLKRAIQREERQKEPKYLEMCRRFIADSQDFSEENLKKAEVQKRFENIDLGKCIQEIIKYIN